MVIIQWMIYINILKVLNKMKELTIQEKAKRYDEAIKLVNSKWYYRNQPCFINVSELFPEFKENKNENIRKWLIEYFQEYKSTGIEGFANGLKIDSIVAWLEKQGKQKSTNKIIIMNKDNKTYKPVYIKCTERNKGKRIIETLEKLGGINKENFAGDNCNALYYIKPNYIIGIIDPDDVDTSFLIYFLNTAEEVKTPIITAKYCYILSYGLGKVFEHFITEDEVDLTTEELLKKHGLNEDECSVMYSNNKLNLENLED